MQETTGLVVAPLVAAGHRSPTVTAIVTPGGVTPQVVVRGVAERGYTIGDGYGKLRGSTVRIGHMGDHTVAGLDGCLDACGHVLRALSQ